MNRAAVPLQQESGTFPAQARRASNCAKFVAV
jgi:hypothetical protein